MLISRLSILNLDKISLEDKIKRAVDLISTMNGQRKVFLDCHWHLYIIDRLKQKDTIKNDKQIKDMFEEENLLIKKKELISLELNEEAHALNKIISAIKKELKPGVNWFKIADKSYPGFFLNYLEVEKFMNDLHKIAN